MAINVIKSCVINEMKVFSVHYLWVWKKNRNSDKNIYKQHGSAAIKEYFYQNINAFNFKYMNHSNVSSNLFSLLFQHKCYFDP